MYIETAQQVQVRIVEQLRHNTAEIVVPAGDMACLLAGMKEMAGIGSHLDAMAVALQAGRWDQSWKELILALAEVMTFATGHGAWSVLESQDNFRARRIALELALLNGS
jgi:hypothetical protein